MNKKIDILPVILCGGSGSRLWPLSRNSYPKQFLKIYNNSNSLFQETLLRFDGIEYEGINKLHSLIVSNELHRFLILNQLKEISYSRKVSILLEPFVKNTAPALTFAALEVSLINPEAIMIVMPSDQYILNGGAFQKILFSAIKEANRGNIITLGIDPKEPNTSYGYIEYKPSSVNVMSVLSFKEKPSLENATKYIASGNYLWNAGIFILKASLWIDAISKCNPDILKTMKVSFGNRVQDGNFIRPDIEYYKKIQEKSIDYAVIEPCISRGFSVKVIKMDLDWEDLGEWSRIYRINKKDKDLNVIKGDCHLIKSNNNLIISSHKLVAAIGIKNLLVVDTPDALLVANLSESNSIKQLVNFLIEKSRLEVDHNRKVFRPWGWYDTLEEGSGFKVKRIQVEPGASLSLQKHKYRSEHWVVTKGEADIICDNKNFKLNINQSSFIPKETIHRLSNKGKNILEIIEIQTGDYLNEDDIERFNDDYGRASYND